MTGLNLQDDLSFDELQVVADKLFGEYQIIRRKAVEIVFAVGDLLNFSLDKYGEKAWQLVPEGYSHKWLQNAKWVASRIPAPRRTGTDVLDADHYYAVAKLDPDTQAALLTRAKDEQIDTKTFRQIVKQERDGGPDPAEQPPLVDLQKRKPIRSPKILASARGEECTISSPWCSFDREETVACHSNFSEDGKGISQKADDIFIAYGCSGCHRWLDASDAPKEEKRDRFHRGLKKTLRKLVDKGLLVVT